MWKILRNVTLPWKEEILEYTVWTSILLRDLFIYRYGIYFNITAFQSKEWNTLEQRQFYREKIVSRVWQYIERVKHKWPI